MYRIIKRILDISLILISLPVLIPIMTLIAIIVFFDLKENPFFLQERGITLDKNRFVVYKFKTMSSQKKSYVNKTTHDLLNNHLHQEVSKLGKWLRLTGIDELPQIFNVLKGEMTLIGPRPLMLSDLEIMKKSYPVLNKKREELNLKPGITGLWQILNDKKEGYYNLLLLDTLYERKCSFLCDTKIMIITLYILFTASNRDSIVANRKIGPFKLSEEFLREEFEL